MDEYTMSWSDALRAMDSLPSMQEILPPAEDINQFGTLGRALWEERSLAWEKATRLGSESPRRKKVAEPARSL